MTSALPGYNRPVQLGPVESEAERIIAAACPGSSVAPWTELELTDPYWGPCRIVSTGFATDARVRFEGASGGAITALARYALKVGLVERVLHVTADARDPAANVVCVSATPDAVLAGAGSRYVASSPLQEIQRMLGEGRRFAFIGKPCDVSALRQLAMVDRRVDALVPLKLAFFCAGIPSRAAVGRVLSKLGVEEGELAAFRYRGNGWPGKTSAETRDGRVTEMSYEESWGGYLSREVQFRCKICPDAVGGVADIACADAWYGGESGYPRFEEQDGRSLILARNAFGAAFLEQAVSAGELKITPLDPREIVLMQPSQARRKRLIRARTLALASLLRPTPVMKGLRVKEASRRSSLDEALRNYLGTLRRAVAGRLSRK